VSGVFVCKAPPLLSSRTTPSCWNRAELRRACHDRISTLIDSQEPLRDRNRHRRRRAPPWHRRAVLRRIELARAVDSLVVNPNAPFRMSTTPHASDPHVQPSRPAHAVHPDGGACWLAKGGGGGGRRCGAHDDARALADASRAAIIFSSSAISSVSGCSATDSAYWRTIRLLY